MVSKILTDWWGLARHTVFQGGVIHYPERVGRERAGAEAPSPSASTWVIDKRPNTLSAKMITADCLASQGFLSMPFTMLV